MTAFTHQLAAHCESGVTASLLTYAGFPLTEPRVLGIGSGLFFLQLPFDTLMGAPSTSFRSKPGSIFRKVTRRLGVACPGARAGRSRLPETLESPRHDAKREQRAADAPRGQLEERRHQERHANAQHRQQRPAAHRWAHAERPMRIWHRTAEAQDR